jgi:hypothetical protein
MATAVTIILMLADFLVDLGKWYVRCTSRLPMTPSAAPSTLGNRKEQRIQHRIRGEIVKQMLIGQRV